MRGMIEPPTYAKLGVTKLFILSNLRVFLDTVEQFGVLEYDTEAGYLVRYAAEDGVVPFIVKTPDGRWVTERVEGIVEVMWRDDY